MTGVVLLSLVTLFYAGYNFLMKVSGTHVPESATTTILATMCVQVAALATSIVFFSWLLARGGHSFSLTSSTYLWAMAAGLCIGAAEIGYLYLFGGVGSIRPMEIGRAHV